MFDIGATEIIVIAVVAILVVGPRDLPRMLRTVGQYVGKLRSMAREFQHQFEEAARDTGLDDVKQGISSVKEFSPGNQIKEAFNSITDEVEDVKTQVEKPAPSEPPASADTASDTSTAKKPASPEGSAAEKATEEPAPAASKEQAT